MAMTPSAGAAAAPGPRFAAMLTEAPGRDLRGAALRRFIAAALGQGWQVLPVLFYGDAVLTTLGGDTRERWQRLQAATGIELVACPAAGERRGLDPSRLEADALFRPLGLPAWLHQALDADRLLRL